MRRLPYPHFKPRTGASYETAERFIKNVKLVKTDAQNLEYAGVVLTQINDDDKTMATAKDELHTFVIGETGCGKTRRVILPTIRLMAKSKRSMIITDPKGEIYKKTAKALIEKGYNVSVLNFRDPSRSDRWNPLELVEKLYKSDSIIDQDKAILLLKDIADILGESVESEKDRFWENEAKKVFIGVALLIIEYCPRGSLTFENISIVSKEISSSSSIQFKMFFDSLPKNSPISANLFAYMNMHTDGKKSVMGVFEGIIGIYVNQRSLLDLFAKSEFDVENIGRKPSVLYLIIPDDSSVMYPMATVFVKQLYSALINLADSNQNGVLNNKVSFILDEFANFAKIPDVESMLTAARSRGITFTLVCQSMRQLEKKYPDGAADVLMSNCRVWMYMSCRDVKFLSHLEELLGKYISPYTGEQYPLVSRSELQHFEMGQVLILNDRSHPWIGHLPDYSLYDFGENSEEATIPNPHDMLVRETIDVAAIIELAERAKRTRDNNLARAALGRLREPAPSPLSSAGASLVDRFTSRPEEVPTPEDPSPTTNGTPDIDAILARLDAKIAAIEAEERALAEADSDEDTDEATFEIPGMNEEAEEEEAVDSYIPDWLMDDDDNDDSDDGDDGDDGDDVPLDKSLLAKLRKRIPDYITDSHDDDNE